MTGNIKSSKNIDFYNICRLCLKQDANLLPLFHISDNLEYKLHKFCNIRVSIEDGLPPQICVPCVEKVNKCYRFKVQCERSDAFLREYFDVEPLTDETDSSVADDRQSSTGTSCFTLEFCSCKAEESEKVNVHLEEEADGDEIQIIYSALADRTLHSNGANEMQLTKDMQVQVEDDGFHGWPSPENNELAKHKSYQACLKRLCKELEEELSLYATEQLQEQACKVKLLQVSGTKTRSPTGQVPEGVSVQQKRFKPTPKKRPEEPQRDYFTRKSWSTLQAKQVQFNNELLKPEHLLLNLGLRPQQDASIQPVESQVENSCLGHVSFKTEHTQFTEECVNEDVENMNTETNDNMQTDSAVMGNVYEGLDTKDEALMESANNFYQVETEHQRISVEEYSINESIDIKEEDNFYYDGTIIEYTNSESEHLTNAPENVPEVPSEDAASLVKIAKEAPQVNVWHWITKHYSGDIQNSDNSSGVDNLYHRLAEKNSLVTVVSETSDPSSPVISDESFPQLNGYHHSEILTLHNENETPSSEEIVVVSDVEENIAEDTSTEICDEVQEMTLLETMSNNIESNNSKGRKCKLCGKTFLVWSSWVSHQKIHENKGLYSCKKCRKTYEQEDLLKKHVDWVHNSQDLKCSECSVVVHTRRGLQRHMNKHKGLRSHRCNLCHRSYFSNSELQTHFEKHLPKQCSICNKIFSHKASLKAHLELHAGIGHRCTLCDKLFSRKLYLERHMRYHSKPTEYSCDKCDRSFLDSNSLLLHKTNMHTT